MANSLSGAVENNDEKEIVHHCSGLHVHATKKKKKIIAAILAETGLQ